MFAWHSRIHWLVLYDYIRCWIYCATDCCMMLIAPLHWKKLFPVLLVYVRDDEIIHLSLVVTWFLTIRRFNKFPFITCLALKIQHAVWFSCFEHKSIKRDLSVGINFEIRSTSLYFVYSYSQSVVFWLRIVYYCYSLVDSVRNLLHES